MGISSWLLGRGWRSDAEAPAKTQVPFGAPLIQQERSDDLLNVMTGVGNRLKDSRLAADWQVEPLSQEQLEAMYRSSDTAATIVEAPVEEMFRRGFDLLIGGEEEESQDISRDTMARLDETDFLDRLQDAICWSRAYGGSAIFIGADDGRDPKEELNEEGIRKFDSLTPLTPSLIRPVAWEDDLRNQRFGQPTLYEIRLQPMPQNGLTPPPPKGRRLAPAAGVAVQVHHTRIIRFDGVRVTPGARKTVQNPGSEWWGDSVLQRPRWLIRDFDTAWQSTARILMTFSMAKYKMLALDKRIAAEDSTRLIFKKIQAIKASMVAAGMIVIDKDEEVDMESTSVAGLADLLDKMAVRVSAAARMPVTVLMGISPAGLNATGASDIRNWYSKVTSQQKKVLLPALKRVLKLLFLAQDGPTDGQEPEDWRIRFLPLWEPTDQESAQVRKTQAETDHIYMTDGVLSPEEVGISRFGGAEYSTETTIDVEARKEGGAALTPADNAEAEAEQAKQEAAAAAQAAAQNGAVGKAVIA